MIISSREAEEDMALNVAKLMLTAARTAPKTGGRDSITTVILTGEEKEKLASAMEKLGKERNRKIYVRDGNNVRNAQAVVLIGVKTGEPPSSWKLIDLGIALGSAVKVASSLNVDNRIMGSVGMVAKEIGLLEGDNVQGIPLSITGKNPFFDR